jgi:enoyl-CoA hydratase/carnithine racemase
LPGPAVPPEAGFTVEVQDAVARITLNRPDRRNPQTPDTWTWLARVGSALPASVRVVVVAGAGPSFSAGLDRALLGDGGGLAALARQSAAEADRVIAGYQAGFAWLAEPRLVSIAAVQGHAVGAGFQLALACDLRVAAADATFTMAEPLLSLVPDLGGTKRLVELVGYSRAVHICLTGHRIGAAEARDIGLADTVVPADALDQAVDDTVTAVLAVPRDAATETKALLRAAGRRTQRDQEAAERTAAYRRLRDLAGLVDER